MTTKQRRPKPARFNEKRVTVRLGPTEAAAVEAMRSAEAKAFPNKTVRESDAIRRLLLENYESAKILAQQPEKLAAVISRVDLPDEAWAALTACENKLAHTQGSAYNISRKLNFGEDVSAEEFAQTVADIAEAKAEVASLVETLLRFVEDQQEN